MSANASALGIIPARYASSRFPGKPLASLSGRPMLQHVYERAARARRLAEVWVATDDERIARTVDGFGGRVVMTSPAHATGTDRVAEAAARPEAARYPVVVNIQGDQPLIAPDALDALVASFDLPAPPDMATLFEPLAGLEDLDDPNVAKVVASADGHALYFSRGPIPYARAAMEGRPRGMEGCFKHVGVYAFRREFLFEFTRLPPGRLESIEGLEQLRVLEAGRRIRLVPSSGNSLSVETPGDLSKAAALLTNR